MDPITMSYYAAVCAVLSGVSGRIPGFAVRLIAGAGVGLVAAAALPSVRAAAGF